MRYHDAKVESQINKKKQYQIQIQYLNKYDNNINNP